MKHFACIDISTGEIKSVATVTDDVDMSGIVEPGLRFQPVAAALAIEFSLWNDSRHREERVRLLDPEFAGEILPEHVEFGFYEDIPCSIDRTSIALPENAVTITGLPAGAVVTIQSVGTFIVPDGALQVRFDYPGIYDIICEARGWASIIYRVTVNA